MQRRKEFLSVTSFIRRKDLSPIKLYAVKLDTRLLKILIFYRLKLGILL